MRRPRILTGCWRQSVDISLEMERGTDGIHRATGRLTAFISAGGFRDPNRARMVTYQDPLERFARDDIDLSAYRADEAEEPDADR